MNLSILIATWYKNVCKLPRFGQITPKILSAWDLDSINMYVCYSKKLSQSSNDEWVYLNKASFDHVTLIRSNISI